MLVSYKFFSQLWEHTYRCCVLKTWSTGPLKSIITSSVGGNALQSLCVTFKFAAARSAAQNTAEFDFHICFRQLTEKGDSKKSELNKGRELW